MLFRLANTEDNTQFGARLLKARVQLDEGKHTLFTTT